MLFRYRSKSIEGGLGSGQELSRHIKTHIDIDIILWATLASHPLTRKPDPSLVIVAVADPGGVRGFNPPPPRFFLVLLVSV